MTEVRLKLITENYNGDQEIFHVDTPFFIDETSLKSIEWFADGIEEIFRTFDLVPVEKTFIDAQGKFIPRFSSTR